MEIKKIFDSGCGDGNCPTIYQTDRGTLLMQGYVLSTEEKTKLNIAENEDIVEIPSDFLKSFLATI